MVGACVGCLYMVSAFIAPRQYKSAWFAFFFFRRSALLWPFFLFYLRTWVQQQQLESTATLKAQERSSSAQREVQIRDPCVCRCFCFFRFCHLRFPLLWRSGGFSCWLRSLWRERYLLCSAKKRKEGLTFRDKQEREQHHSLIGLRARREDQPAVLLLCTRARAAIKHHHRAVYRIFLFSLSFLLFSCFRVWAVRRFPRPGFCGFEAPARGIRNIKGKGRRSW